MDLLDRLLGHDAWTTHLLLERCRALPDADLDRAFDLGHGSLRATFVHLIWNMEAWSDQIAGRPLRAKPEPGPAGWTADALLARLERAAEGLARAARGVRDRGGYDETWTDGRGVAKTRGGSIAHVITHSMHHRAQILAMMRWLGVADRPEGDLLSWEEQARRGST